MATNWEKRRYRDFTGGENIKVLPEAVAVNQVFRAQNCVITNEGLLETRLGKTKINTVSLGVGPVISAHRFVKEDGSKYLLAQHGTSLYVKSWDGATPFADFGSAIKTNLDPAKLRSVVWKDVIILTNGVDQAFAYDGVVCTDVAAIPLCKALYLYAGRLWCVDETTGLVENSNLENYTDWSESGSYKVRDGEGDRVIGMSPQDGGMVLFKQTSACTLYGTNKNNIAIKDPFSKRYGCVAIDSILDEGMVLALDNMYSFTLNSMTPFPATHTPLIKSLTLAQKQTAFAIPHPATKRALLHLPSTELCVHGEWNAAITSWTGLNAQCFAVADSKDDSGALVIGDATDGFLYTYEGDDDAGTNIETRIKSAYDDFESYETKEWSSYIPEVEELQSGVFRLYYNYDIDFELSGGAFSSSHDRESMTWGVDKWNAAKWGTDSRINEPFFLHDICRGNRISFETISLKRIRFNGYTTKYRIVGAKI